MNALEYQQNSLRTVPAHLSFWTRDFEGDSEEARKLLVINCALGLAGEAAEIGLDTTSDEIGDGYWYAYVLLFAMEKEGFEPLDDGIIPTPHQALSRSAGLICEQVKKWVFHGRDFDTIRSNIVEGVMDYLQALAALDKQPAAQTFAQNVDKLKRRYPAGFQELG